MNLYYYKRQLSPDLRAVGVVPRASSAEACHDAFLPRLALGCAFDAPDSSTRTCHMDNVTEVSFELELNI